MGEAPPRAPELGYTYKLDETAQLVAVHVVLHRELIHLGGILALFGQKAHELSRRKTRRCPLFLFALIAYSRM